MDRIAISTDNNQVSMHFGRCPIFTIVDIENKKISNKIEINNPGHEPGFLPQFMKDKGVQYMIAGGMGPRASQLFAQHNIKTLIGISGSIQDVINQYIQGTLLPGDSTCAPGEGKGYGVEKTGGCDHGGNNK